MDRISNIQKLYDFRQYLDTSPRIILSAKFGDGKTTFLKEMVELSMNPINEKVHFDDYQFFTIYPINYVVAKNEDIFEYVKRDILLQLYNQNLLNKLNLKDLFDSVFSYEDLKSVISFLLCSVPGGAFSDKLFHIVDKKYHDYQEKKETFKKFELKFENQIGGIYENDGYTQMIKYALDIIKNGDSEATKKKPVLVIEDLDRLDPAHLFRILNIISAHIDQTSYNNDNKFGFNNIILVMDYEATKHVFHYFYGERANYEGYISKFLSVPPFYYSVKELVIKQVKDSIFNIIGCMDALNSFSLFNEKIASMSMRDLFKLQGFKCNKRIKTHAVSIWNLTFSTEMPLYRLII